MNTRPRWEHDRFSRMSLISSRTLERGTGVRPNVLTHFNRRWMELSTDV